MMNMLVLMAFAKLISAAENSAVANARTAAENQLDYVELLVNRKDAQFSCC